MSIAEIKNDLHRLVVETNDESILKAIHKFFLELVKEGKGTDWWEELNERDKKNVERGLEESKNGVVYSDAEVRKGVKEWFETKKII